MANASLQAKTGSGLLFYVGTGTDPETGRPLTARHGAHEPAASSAGHRVA